MYLEYKALSLLWSHVMKLYELSTSMDTWRQSKYESLLTLYHSATLADVRNMWEFDSIE